MRTLHIDTGREMRGGQRQVLLLLEALREAGHETILLAAAGSPLANAACAANFEVHPAHLWNVARYSGKADVVHAHDARAHTYAALACRRVYVVSRRVAFPVRSSLISRWKYGSASRYLAVSEFVSNVLQRAGLEPSLIDVVYDAVEEVAPNDSWSPEYPAVALASRDPQKGRDLVEAAAKISGVEMLFSDDLSQDLRQASMFVYITRSEGLGSAALLAMQMGVPLIASAVGGLTEIFTDGMSGLAVRNEPGDIVRSMRRILGNPLLASRLIQAGKNRIGEAFTRNHLLEGTLKSYRRAIEF